MPIYTYECERGHQADIVRPIKDHANPVVCDICGRVARQVITKCSTCPFPAGIWEDIAPHPIEIRSKKHLERECRSRGVYARNYMENYSPRERLIRYGG